MPWWGKVFGGALGTMLAGPIGTALGVALGHQLDKGLTMQSRRFNQTQGSIFEGGNRRTESIQTAFFTTLFICLGRISKADGHVSQQEILFAKEKMVELGLNEAQKKTAINLFESGKDQNVDLNAILQQFHSITKVSPDIRRIFLELLHQCAFADGKVSEQEQTLLDQIAAKLGLSASGGNNKAHQKAQGQHSLTEAYACLEAQPSWSMDEISKAYKRKITQFHPDKLISKGLPEEMIRFATDKTASIKAAYDQIRKNRNAH